MKIIHSKFESENMEFIKWNSDLAAQLKCDKGIYAVVDVVGTPGIGSFKNIKSRQLIINDYKIEKRLEFFR